jgi:CSLREA domain-containing protein
VRLACEPLEGRDCPATFTVNTLADGDPVADGLTTLREAIIAVNASSDGTNTINFAATTKGTISLTEALPTISKPVKIYGLGRDDTIITRAADAATEFRIFWIGGPNAVVSMSKLTVSGGRILTNPPLDFPSGGGISVDGQLTMTDCAVKDSKVSGNGGGIYVSGKLTLDNCEVSGNQANDNGAGIFISRGTVEIKNDSLVFNNTSESRGGGIYVNASSTKTETSTVSINDSKINGNTSRLEGGGIFVALGRSGTQVEVTAKNSWFDGNWSRESNGAAVYADSKFHATSCSFNGNTGRANAGYVIHSASSPDPNLFTVVTLIGCDVLNNRSTPNPYAPPDYAGGAIAAGPGLWTGLTGCNIAGNSGYGVMGLVSSGGFNYAENSAFSSDGWVDTDEVY